MTMYDVIMLVIGVVIILIIGFIFLIGFLVDKSIRNKYKIDVEIKKKRDALQW